MASKKTSQLDVANTIADSDRIVIVSDPSGSPATETITFTNLKSRIIASNTALANTTATAGTMLFDSNYLYIAVANNTFKRVSLSSF